MPDARVLVAAVAILAAGCIDATSTQGDGEAALPAVDDVESPAPEGTMYLSFRIPNNIGDEFGFDVAVESPDGLAQSGDFHFYLEEDAPCISAYVPDEVDPECCDNRVRATGDFHCADAEEVGPYTYAFFPQAALAGNWTLDIVRTSSDGLPDLQGGTDHCLHVGFSHPDQAFVDGGTAYETECVVTARLSVDPFSDEA